MRYLLGMLLMGLTFAAFLLPRPAAAADEICFSDTNPEIKNCISGIFKVHWERNGGLELLGYPLSKTTIEKRAEGDIETQWFERAKVERFKGKTPEMVHAKLGEVLLRSKGREVGAGAAEQPKDGCQFFAETGRNVCEPFLSFIKSHGIRYDRDQAVSAEESLALFGQPITAAAPERAADGKEYLTQWFEQTRLELHPELPAGQQVLMGLVGAEVYSAQQASVPQQQATPEPAKPTCQPIEQPLNAFVTENCLTNDNRYRTIFSLSGYKANERIGVWLVDADGIEIDSPIDRVRTARCPLAGSVFDFTDIARCTWVTVNEYGNASGITFDAALLYPGRWMLVFESIEDERRTSRIYFEVLPRPLGKDDPCATVTASTNATMNPTCAPAGGLVKMVSTGYQGEEEVSYFITYPDTIVEPVVAFHAPKRATVDGAAVLVAQVPNSSLRDEYLITATGAESRHQAIGIVRSR